MADEDDDHSDTTIQEAHQKFDWSAHYDDEGQLYYYNSKTDESSWDPPAEGFNPPPSPAREEQCGEHSDGDKKDDGDGNDDVASVEKEDIKETTSTRTPITAAKWEAHKDEEGNEYYYNPDTGETQWEKPEGEINTLLSDRDVLPDTRGTQEDDGEEEHQVDALPASPMQQPDADDSALPASPSQPMDVDENQDNLVVETRKKKKENDEITVREKWVAHKDDEGIEYYHNEQTGETSWEKPENAVVVDASEMDADEQQQTADDDAEAEDKEQEEEEEEKFSLTPPPPKQDDDDNEYDGIPAKWIAHKDEEGNQYFYNTETGETQWEKPVGEKVVDASKVEASVGETTSAVAAPTAEKKEQEDAEPPITDGIPAKWILHWDDDGAEYYYNTETGETQWEKPVDGMVVDASEAQAPPGAEEKQHAAANDGGGPDQTPSADGGPLPPNWEAHKDDEDRVYYYNTETGETRWDRPEGKADEDDEKKVRTTKSAKTEAEEEPSMKDEEEEPMEVEEEIDPAVKRLQEAEAFLNQPDSILEPNCFVNLAEVVTRDGGNPTKAMTALVENYQSQTAVCGILARWLSNLKSVSSTSKTKTKEESYEAMNDEIRKTVQEVINRVAKERFTKELGDEILHLSSAQAKFLGEMMDSSRWRKLLIDLSASHKDSAVLMYCLQNISKRGHHREIARRINQSDHFPVFRQMLQSELTVIGKMSVSAGSDVKTAMGMEELVSDLRRACTATSYTYLYSLEVLRALEQETAQRDNADPQTRRAFRKWERLREDLENTMQDPTVAINLGGSHLFRKRRLDIALTINELNQRQRRRYVPPSEAVDQKTGLDNLDDALLNFLRQYANNVHINDSLLDPLVPSGLDLESHKNVGVLLTKHPLAIRVMLGCLYKPGALRATSPSLRNKCARLIALAVCAAEDSVEGNGKGAEKSTDVSIQRKILLGCELCEQLEIMVSFLVTDVDSTTTTPSPGRKLCDLAKECAVVAQGAIIWAKELTHGPDFAGSASFPTLSVSILSLVRRVALEQPFTRRDALSVALAFTKQYNAYVSYQKLSAIKEQSIRLMLCLMAKGDVSSVLSGVANRLSQQPELDASLVRYFVSGLLEIVKVPVSIAFARVLAEFLRVPKCVDAVRSSYFVEPHKTRLTLLLKSFKQLLVKDDPVTGKVDKAWVESVLATYRLE